MAQPLPSGHFVDRLLMEIVFVAKAFSYSASSVSSRKKIPSSTPTLSSPSISVLSGTNIRLDTPLLSVDLPLYSHHHDQQLHPTELHGIDEPSTDTITKRTDDAPALPTSAGEKPQAEVKSW